jgi:hypothetical protein
MRTYTVIAESYNEEKSERFTVLAENQDRAWARAYYHCAQLNENNGRSWSPVEVLLKDEEDL